MNISSSFYKHETKERWRAKKGEVTAKRRKSDLMKSSPKNLVLDVFPLIQGCSSTWYGCWEERITLWCKIPTLAKWRSWRRKVRIQSSFICYECLWMLWCVEMHGNHRNNVCWRVGRVHGWFVKAMVQLFYLVFWLLLMLGMICICCRVKKWMEYMKLCM